MAGHEENERANVPSPKPRLNAERHVTYSSHTSQGVEYAKPGAYLFLLHLLFLFLRNLHSRILLVV